MFIETIINQALSLDPKVSQRFKKLQGKILKIKINIQDKERFFLVKFREEGIQLTNAEDPNTHPPHVIICGPLKAFLSLAFTKNPYTATRLGLSFEGETETLETIQALFFSLDIDWEEYLSQWTGDIVAHQIGRLARFAKKRQKELYQSTKQSITEYLTEESKLLPTRIEIDGFLDAVDLLRADVDRLFLRIEGIHLR